MSISFGLINWAWNHALGAADLPQTALILFSFISIFLPINKYVISITQPRMTLRIFQIWSCPVHTLKKIANSFGFTFHFIARRSGLRLHPSFHCQICISLWNLMLKGANSLIEFFAVVVMLCSGKLTSHSTALYHLSQNISTFES